MYFYIIIIQCCINTFKISRIKSYQFSEVCLFVLFDAAFWAQSFFYLVYVAYSFYQSQRTHLLIFLCGTQGHFSSVGLSNTRVTIFISILYSSNEISFISQQRYYSSSYLHFVTTLLEEQISTFYPTLNFSHA